MRTNTLPHTSTLRDNAAMTTPDTTPEPAEEKPLTAAQKAAQKRKEKRALADAALRRVKKDEAMAAAARATERQKRREENQRKHREMQALKKRDTDAPENTELWHAVATRQAQGRDLLAACIEVYGQEEADAAAERMQKDGRYSRLLARYKAMRNKTDDEVRQDLESFYYATMHDSELDPKARLAAAKQLQQLRNLEKQQIEVQHNVVDDFVRAQLAITESQPHPWQQGAVDV